IEASLGEVWRTIRLSRPLNEAVRRVAAELGYELPREAEESSGQVRREHFVEVRGVELCLCDWGPEEGPPVLCVHGVLEQGAAWGGPGGAGAGGGAPLSPPRPGGGAAGGAPPPAARGTA